MSKHIPFSKMHGLGNDFVIINNADAAFDLTNLNISSMADRHLGIGFDQLLIIDALENNKAKCRIFNADGSEAVQCGNGLRCLARYLHENHLCNANNVTIQTRSGEYPIEIEDYQHISIDMGSPEVLEPEFKLTDEITASIISMGNPHLIVPLTFIDSIKLDDLAEQINRLDEFRQGINIGFMQINRPDNITLRTFERGSGETLACGSNASAAVVCGHQLHGMSSRVSISLPKGNLLVEVMEKSGRVKLTGPAAFAFSGTFSN